MGLAAGGVLVGPGIVSCGGGDGSQLLALDRIGREDAPNSMEVQLNVGYTPQSPIQSWADGFERLFTQFAQEHRDWKLDLKAIPGDQTTQEQARLLEAARVGRAPALANVDSFVVAQFIGQGALKPLNEYFTQAQIDGLYPFVRDIVVGDDGKMYAYWWATDLRLLYRRTDLVPEAPKTTDELIKAALAAKKKDPNVDGYLYNGGRWEGTTFDNLAYFWSQGGRLVDDEGNPIFSEGKNREYMLNLFEFLNRTVQSGASPQRVSTITNYDEFQAAAEAGTVAMFLGGDFQWPALKESLPPEEFEKWEVTADPVIPTLNPNDTPATGTGGWTNAAFADDPEKVKIGMEFTKECYIGEANQVTGQLPTSPELFKKYDTFSDPIYDVFRKGLEYGQARPGYAIYPKISSAIQVAIGTVLTGGATPEQAVDRVVSEIGQ